jgi:membrane-associated phospholipid phosphatase
MTELDRWGVEHAMPFAGAPGAAPTLADSIVPLYHVSFHPLGHAVAEIVTLPGQVLVSLALVAMASRHLWKRGRVDAAVFSLAAWFLAVAIEIVFRHTLTRPPLYHDAVHIVAFDNSWPSGHTLRAAIAAAALAVAWPRLRPLLAVWLVVVMVLLELAGFHTPTDILGGLLLAVVAAAAAIECERSGLLRRRRLRHMRTTA